jgi:hypothetical protein
MKEKKGKRKFMRGYNMTFSSATQLVINAGMPMRHRKGEQTRKRIESESDTRQTTNEKEEKQSRGSSNIGG